MNKKKKAYAAGVLFEGLSLFTVDGVQINNSRLTVNTNSEWSVAGNQAEIVSATNTNRRLATPPSDPILKLAQNYSVEFEVVSVTGSVRVVAGDGFGTNRSAPGIYTQTLNTGANQQIEVRNFAAGTSAVVRNVKYTEVP